MLILISYIPEHCSHNKQKIIL